jgi:hypothetical protein
MKFAIILLSISTLALNSYAQCNSDLLSEKSMRSISPGFMFEKSYRIDGKGGAKNKIEFTCILSKDTNYQFTMTTKDGGSENMTFNLLDSKKNTVASNFVNDKFFSSLTFRCRSTGLYYLSFNFAESSSFCGAAVVAFRR